MFPGRLTVTIAAVSAVAALAAGPPAGAVGHPATAPPHVAALHVAATVVLPTGVAGQVSTGPDPSLFAEAPDSAVYIAHGRSVYVVHGSRPPVLTERAAGPVLALAASATRLYVETGLTVTAYRRDGGRPVRHWTLHSPQRPTSAGLFAEGGVLWSWTDWATDLSGFQFATVSRIPLAGTVAHVVDQLAYPGDLDADAAGLFYERTSESGVGRLARVTPAGRLLLSPRAVLVGAPLTVDGGTVLLTDVINDQQRFYAQSYRAATLVRIASTPMTTTALVSTADTGVGILGVIIPCKGGEGLRRGGSRAARTDDRPPDRPARPARSAARARRPDAGDRRLPRCSRRAGAAEHLTADRAPRARGYQRRRSPMAIVIRKTARQPSST